jgi:hypothetical protein
MFAKPFSLILVYVVACFNLLFILSPFLAVLLPFIDYQKGEFIISGSIFSKLIDAFGFAHRGLMVYGYKVTKDDGAVFMPAAKSALP